MMYKKEREEQIIESYKHDEKMMILIYAQWCINQDLDPRIMYEEAYPEQMKNDALDEVMELTVTKQESDDIPDESVLHALQVFGNDDLAFLVQEKSEEMAKKRAKAES